MKLNNLNFHQTFPPEAGMLSRLITSDIFDTPLTKEEISMRTGIPTGASSGKVEPHIDYAVYMGLIEDTINDGKHCLSLTLLGEQILEEDPGFCEEVTILTCYLRMVSPYGGAPLWETIMCEILPKSNTMVSEAAILSILQKNTTSKIHMGPFGTSFQKQMFSTLDILETDNDSMKIKKHSYNPELVYVYAYALLHEWENAFPRQQELSADQVAGLIISGALGWKESDIYYAMEAMQDKGILTFNRQLVPYTVVKRFESNTIIPRLYSELC